MRSITAPLFPRISLAGLLLLIFSPHSLFAGEPPIIPRPQSVEIRKGVFRISRATTLFAGSPEGEVRHLAGYLADGMEVSCGVRPEIVPSLSRGAITLAVNADLAQGEPEAYRLAVDTDRVSLTGASPAGLFRGLQTLLQLVPLPRAPVQGEEGVTVGIPCLTIDDRPRFPWRGMHLDVGRHFFPKEFIKRYIDLLAAYKMNTFHWHLTEDQGWRIEIKRFPRLVSVGAWRRETMGDGIPHGGYYTQDEIREIVRYAADRYISVIPEIEMPGHSLAALAAYPELSCSGGPFNVGTEWGVFDDVYCAGNERTFEFLTAVIDEVTTLFPAPYVHVGGDECPTVRWQKCPRCQERIRNEGLRDERELQSYFIRRIGMHLASRGKRLVGWDEILEGGLAPDATVMSWRGVEGGIAAAEAGHDVVMTPTSHCYLDYRQGTYDGPTEVGGVLPLETVYAFEPVPPSLDSAKAGHVLGAQGNVWTEWMPGPGHVEYMLLPRMLAMSEVVWTPRERRDLTGFLARLEDHYDRLGAAGFTVRIPPPPGIGGRVILLRDTTVTLEPPMSKARVLSQLDTGTGFGDTVVAGDPIRITGNALLNAWTDLGSGRTSAPVVTSFQMIDPRRNGLAYRYYEGEWDRLPDFGSITPSAEGRAYDIDLNAVRHRPERFALTLEGMVTIDSDDSCTFTLVSDDGSRLLINGEVVVDNDGLHGMSGRSGTVSLTSGRHPITVEYFQRGGGSGLSLFMEARNLSRRRMPADRLSPR